MGMGIAEAESWTRRKLKRNLSQRQQGGSEVGERFYNIILLVYM